MRALIIGAIASIAAIACGACAPSRPPAPAPSASTASTLDSAALRIAHWREDVQFFARELPARHINAWAHTDRRTFDGEVARLDADIPRLNDRQIRWRLMRLTALLRDGHTNGPLPTYSQRVPFSALWTDRGAFITGVAAEYVGLRGARIVAVNGHPIAAIADTVRRYLPHENEQGMRNRAGWILYYPGAQRDLGLGDDSTRIELVVEDAAHKQRTVTLPAVPRQGYAPAVFNEAVPLYRSRVNERYWFKYLPENRTLYLQYNVCQNDSAFRVLVDSLTRVIDTQHPARFLVDLRNNTGGSSRVIKPLFEAIKARPEIDRPDVLYVAIGRVTFSSGLMAAVDFKRETKATLIGEPPGERPNTFGELKSFKLPNSGLEVTYSTKYFRLVDGDPDAFYPDVSVPPEVEALVANRDQVLEWILARH